MTNVNKQPKSEAYINAISSVVHHRAVMAEALSAQNFHNTDLNQIVALADESERTLVAMYARDLGLEVSDPA